MTEAQIQSQLIQWWELAHKGLRVPDKRLLIMVPNGAKFGRGAKRMKNGREVPLAALQMASMKRQGFVQGAPDLFLATCRVHRRQFFGGLWIEMKRPGGIISAAQFEMHGLLVAAGYRVVVAWSFDEAVNHIVDYLAGEPLAYAPL